MGADSHRVQHGPARSLPHAHLSALPCSTSQVALQWTKVWWRGWKRGGAEQWREAEMEPGRRAQVRDRADVNRGTRTLRHDHVFRRQRRPHTAAWPLLVTPLGWAVCRAQPEPYIDTDSTSNMLPGHRITVVLDNDGGQRWENICVLDWTSVKDHNLPFLCVFTSHFLLNCQCLI